MAVLNPVGLEAKVPAEAQQKRRPALSMNPPQAMEETSTFYRLAEENLPTPALFWLQL